MGRELFRRADVNFEKREAEDAGELTVAEADRGGVAVPAERVLAGFERDALDGLADDTLAGKVTFEGGAEGGLEKFRLRFEVGSFEREFGGEAAVEIERLAFEVEAEIEDVSAFQDQGGAEVFRGSDGREDFAERRISIVRIVRGAWIRWG